MDIDAIKSGIWERHGIDSLKSDAWFNDPLVFSWCVGMLLEKLSEKEPFRGSRIVGHFHEWLSGFSLLYLKDRGVPIATVFTTHATMLGRTMSGHGQNPHDSSHADKGVEEFMEAAKRYGCQDKHSTEVACANASDVFSTVSDVTGREAKLLLGVEPDILLYNGLDLSTFPELEDLSVMRKRYRKSMRDFLRSFFLRYYDLDMSRIKSLFISGRHEFHNKGIDVLIDSLGRLNDSLKAENSEKQMLAFIFVPAGTRGENIEVLKNKAQYEQIMLHVEGMLPEIKDRIIESVARGMVPKDDIISRGEGADLRRLAAQFADKLGGNPPICAFELDVSPENNEIIQALIRNGITNKEEDRVKAIYYPAYLSSGDRLISMEYGPATLTCDVGVFPSFYEPWGYTPLETAAQGTPTITSDLAGYGQFIKGRGDGIHVLSMRERQYDEIVNELCLKLREIVEMPKSELTMRRMNARQLAHLADWKSLAKNYVKAHGMALEKNP